MFDKILDASRHARWRIAQKKPARPTNRALMTFPMKILPVTCRCVSQQESQPFCRITICFLLSSPFLVFECAFVCAPSPNPSSLRWTLYPALTTEIFYFKSSMRPILTFAEYDNCKPTICFFVLPLGSTRDERQLNGKKLNFSWNPLYSIQIDLQPNPHLENEVYSKSLLGPPLTPNKLKRIASELVKTSVNFAGRQRHHHHPPECAPEPHQNRMHQSID